MSEPAETVPANPSEPNPSLLLEDVFFAPLFQALQAPGITRGCAIIDFQYAANLKQSKDIYILTAWKDNLAPECLNQAPSLMDDYKELGRRASGQ